MAEEVYVILGATGGIGSALCRRLAATGARLVVGARRPDELAALAEETGAQAFALDARQFDEVDSCLDRALEVYGRVDGVVNCVGSLLLKPAHLTTEAEWASALATNLGSAFAAVRAGARAMLKTGGSIVLVSAAAARAGLASHEAIAAVKAGVIGLTLAAAASYAARQVRVNCVAPGLVRTPLTARITGNEAALNASAALHALGRVGEPGEVASAIAWLLAPEQGWVTGQVLGVDGGLATVRPRA
ncbi:MAG TPA: SDR family oxidoreductase [Blastocatellia bacterium]|nr:SDR family oxidoreductase [Blastocatellia bacterium]